MRITVISPESDDPREMRAMEGMFTLGLERYHVRKPAWSLPQLESWILGLPALWRPRLVLHEHHGLVGKLGLGGRHEKDRPSHGETAGVSRSCHDLPSLSHCIGRYGQVLFGPIFPSLSKPGYGPAGDFPWEELKSVLSRADGRTGSRVLALGGITAGRLHRCFELGFDGAAVIGAVWSRPDPIEAYVELRDHAETLWGARHAA